jgi:cyclopropane fatty-acyl-phospholipid synthase-like methyltransferase
MLDTDRVRAGYDRIAARYAETRDQASSVPYLEKLEGRLAADSLILDLGCGAGLPVDRRLINHGHRVIGVDISDAMLTLARRNVPEASYRLRDMATLKQDEYSVDAVVSFFAMFHIDRRYHRDLLCGIRSYLQEGGLILVTTGRSDWEGEEDFLGVQMLWSHFDEAANGELIRNSGFTVLFEGLHRGNSIGDKDWHPIFLARAV